MQYYTFKWSWKTAQAISLFFTLQKARNSESYLVQSQSIIILFKLAVVLTKLIVQVVVLLLFGFRTWLWSLGRLIPNEFFCSQKRLWIGVLWYLKTPCIFFSRGRVDRVSRRIVPEDRPADNGSHGIYATDLKADHYRFQGSSFLRDHPLKWPINNDQPPEGTDLEEMYPVHIGEVTAAKTRIDQLIQI
jgi:hypothetical protein